MFKTILVPTDGSSLAEKAVGPAVDMARQFGGKIVAISVAEPPSTALLYEGGGATAALDNYQERAHEAAQKHVDRIRDMASAANVPCDTVVATGLYPYDEIVAAATKYGCDMISIGSHGRKGLSRLFAGSETQKVLAHSTIPVLVVR